MRALEGGWKMYVFVARQPILTVADEVFGYELLYRNSEENRFVPVDPNKATSEVLMNGFITIGLERLSRNKPCFINFTEDLLLEKVPEYFRPDQLVIEILENVSLSLDLIRVCRDLKQKGYLIALDDMIDINRPALMELLHYVDILKVDVRAVSDENRRKIIQLAEDFSLTLLAEKVETLEEHQRCMKEGFRLFQGFYYSKPVIVQASSIMPLNITYLRLIRELSVLEESVDVDKVTSILEQDLALTYKLLRLINSSLYKPKYSIRSIKQAVMLLGTETLKKWMYVLTVENAAPPTHPREQLVMKTSLTRAKVCEQLALASGEGDMADGHFLTGFLSLIDVITQRPLAEAVSILPLEADILAALQGGENRFRKILELAVHLETADFQKLGESLGGMPLNVSTVFEIYAQAVSWTEELFQENFMEKITE